MLGVGGIKPLSLPMMDVNFTAQGEVNYFLERYSSSGLSRTEKADLQTVISSFIRLCSEQKGHDDLSYALI